jgi:hypothetical protein
MKKYTFNEKSTLVIYEPSEITKDIALSPMEYLEDIDSYILVSPYDQEAYIEAYVRNGNIYIVFERDEYEIPFDFRGLQIITAMSEIWFDTEDITEIREYLENINTK